MIAATNVLKNEEGQYVYIENKKECQKKWLIDRVQTIRIYSNNRISKFILIFCMYRNVDRKFFKQLQYTVIISLGSANI